jgi:uncharacterized RmlC-like cupin family protein
MSTADRRTCVVVRPGGSQASRQGLEYQEGVSAESAGSTGLCMHRLVIPPGGAARPHLHEDHETAILVLSGRAEMTFGEGLARRLTVEAGDFLYIPAGMPHRPANVSATEECVAVVARTDPSEQESVVLLDERGRREPLPFRRPAPLSDIVTRADPGTSSGIALRRRRVDSQPRCRR